MTKFAISNENFWIWQAAFHAVSKYPKIYYGFEKDYLNTACRYGIVFG